MSTDYPYPEFQPITLGSPDSPWIIFFAGWGTEAEDYRERLSTISTDFYIIGFTLPGFGNGEPLPANNTVKGHATFFTNYLVNHFGIEKPVTLMGHSTGGGVAALVASQLQSLAEHLILISPIGSPEPVIRSGPRMIRHINWRKARRWLRGGYRRRFLPNMMLGINAKQVDITSDILRINEQGTNIKLFLARDDRVAPAGKLSSVLDVNHITWVDGGHSWFQHDSRAVHDYLLSLNWREHAQREASETGWWGSAKTWISGVLSGIESMLVPSTPIIVETVIKADEEIKEDKRLNE